MTYTTAALVQAELKLTVPFSSSTNPTLTTINTWIEQEGSEVDRLTQNRYKVQTKTVLINYNGEDRIQLKDSPLIEVTSVKYATHSLGTDDYPSFETKEEDKDYTVFKDRGEIAILLNRWRPRPGMKRIEIVYDSGFADTPGYIEALTTKLVALRLMDSAALDSVSTGKADKSFRMGSVSILNNSRVGIHKYQDLKLGIEELKKEILKSTTAIRYINY